MMITSPGIRSDLLFHTHLGEVIPHSDYVVIKTPHNPSYFWGNYLIFPQPPRLGDTSKWKTAFQRAFADQTGIHHMLFNWSGEAPQEALDEFLEDGFQLESTTVLQTQKLYHRPQSFSRDLDIILIKEPHHWRAVEDLQLLSSMKEYKESEYRPFLQKKFEDYRTLISKGKGFWFGGYLGDRLVADLGIFFDGNIARFQNIETHPDYQRQGFCTQMILTAADYVKSRHLANEFVIQSESGSLASQIYASLGFQQQETLYGLSWYDKKIWAN